MEEKTGKLFVDGKEIALVYFRYSCMPRHFTRPED